MNLYFLGILQGATLILICFNANQVYNNNKELKKFIEDNNKKGEK